MIPSVVTGQWISTEATISPFFSVVFFSGSALTSAGSGRLDVRGAHTGHQVGESVLGDITGQEQLEQGEGQLFKLLTKSATIFNLSYVRVHL